MLFFHYPDNAVDVAFQFWFMAYDDGLLDVQLFKDISKFIQLLCWEAVCWFVKDYEIFCLYGADEVVYDFVEGQSIC